MAEKEQRLRKPIISLDIDIIQYKDALNEIIAKAKMKTRCYVCFANVHMVIEAYKDKVFADQVNHATLVLADGMPIINVLRSFYKLTQERIAGMDVLPDLIRMSEFHGVSVFFFGSSNELLEKIRARTERQFPKLKIAGVFSPPFDKPIDDRKYISLINESGADLVFVALGCPKQEKWMAKHSPKLAAILLGVGGAFPLYAETTKRAPLWLRNISLEWVYRLYQEPTRLFKRYLVTNTLFLYLTVKVRINKILQKSSNNLQA